MSRERSFFPSDPSYSEACPICQPQLFDASLAKTPGVYACPLHRLHPGLRGFRLVVPVTSGPELAQRLVIQGSVRKL